MFFHQCAGPTSTRVVVPVWYRREATLQPDPWSSALTGSVMDMLSTYWSSQSSVKTPKHLSVAFLRTASVSLPHIYSKVSLVLISVGTTICCLQLDDPDYRLGTPARVQWTLYLPEARAAGADFLSRPFLIKLLLLLLLQCIANKCILPPPRGPTTGAVANCNLCAFICIDFVYWSVLYVLYFVIVFSVVSLGSKVQPLTNCIISGRCTHKFGFIINLNWLQTAYDLENSDNCSGRRCLMHRIERWSKMRSAPSHFWKKCWFLILHESRNIYFVLLCVICNTVYQ